MGSKRKETQKDCHLYEVPISAYDDIFSKYSNFEARERMPGPLPDPPPMDIFPTTSQDNENYQPLIESDNIRSEPSWNS